MESFDYQTIKGIDSPISILPLRLQNLETKTIIKTEGILDTGSDFTLVSPELINKLQPTSIGLHKSVQLQGIVDKAIVTGVPYIIGINIYNQVFDRVKVFCCANLDIGEYVLIGRNLLNRYRIIFDGCKRKIFLESC